MNRIILSALVGLAAVAFSVVIYYTPWLRLFKWLWRFPRWVQSNTWATLVCTLLGMFLMPVGSIWRAYCEDYDCYVPGGWISWATAIVGATAVMAFFVIPAYRSRNSHLGSKKPEGRE